jgi:hypothetical protein
MQIAQRRAFAYAMGFLTLLMMISAGLSCRAHQFTNSVAFCGAIIQQFVT